MSTAIKEPSAFVRVESYGILQYRSPATGNSQPAKSEPIKPPLLLDMIAKPTDRQQIQQFFSNLMDDVYTGLSQDEFQNRLVDFTRSYLSDNQSKREKAQVIRTLGAFAKIANNVKASEEHRSAVQQIKQELMVRPVLYKAYPTKSITDQYKVTQEQIAQTIAQCAVVQELEPESVSTPSLGWGAWIVGEEKISNRVNENCVEQKGLVIDYKI